jgi:hypothetical protein
LGHAARDRGDRSANILTSVSGSGKAGQTRFYKSMPNVATNKVKHTDKYVTIILTIFSILTSVDGYRKVLQNHAQYGH